MQGAATFTTSALAVAGHTITAVYGGDSNFTTSTSSGLTQTVNKGATTTSLGSSANPSVFGQSVTFTATVAVTAPASGTPTGTVTFKDGATTLGTGTLTAGTATFATSALALAGHTITAVYGGDSNFTTSTSSGLTQTVNQGATDHVARLLGQPERVRPVGDVHGDRRGDAPAAGTPTGTVTFKDGATTLGTGTLSGRHRDFTHLGACAGRPHDHGGLRRRHATSRPRRRPA